MLETFDAPLLNPNCEIRNRSTVAPQSLRRRSIADDVTPDLALSTIAAVEVLGAFRAPREVKAALASRTA